MSPLRGPALLIKEASVSQGEDEEADCMVLVGSFQSPDLGHVLMNFQRKPSSNESGKKSVVHLNTSTWMSLSSLCHNRPSGLREARERQGRPVVETTLSFHVVHLGGR